MVFFLQHNLFCYYFCLLLLVDGEQFDVEDEGGANEFSPTTRSPKSIMFTKFISEHHALLFIVLLHFQQNEKHLLLKLVFGESNKYMFPLRHLIQKYYLFVQSFPTRVTESTSEHLLLS